MKLKLLLFSMLLSVGVFAQEAYKGLVITEARLHARDWSYLEITNMGNQTVNLNEFEVGKISPWIEAYEGGGEYFRLPERNLEPGKSFVITIGFDFGEEQYKKKTPGFEGNGRMKQPEMYQLADFIIHQAEPKGDATDSITPNPPFSQGITSVLDVWWGREGWYIEQHLSESDSVVIDQVNGMFDDPNGRNYSTGRYDVAGTAQATYNSILVRKYIVKQGNLDFANARGVGADDSEWMTLPPYASHWRDVYWTVGNHGDYKLDASTFESSVADVDFTNKKITVPWGTRRADGVMRLMNRKPGVAWEYILKPGTVEDSLKHSAQTGDVLRVYVLGSSKQTADFDIIVSEPTASSNIVVPVTNRGWAGAQNQWYRNDVQAGILGWPRVTTHPSGIDTITGNSFGIPYATRIDSLLKQLEKPSNAKWEIVPVDGVARPDLKYGDKLKVIAQNGEVKEYFIEMRPLMPGHNAFLSAITWPDIPTEYRGIFGWVGDTIPNFDKTTYNYKITVPADVQGIPALLAKTEDLNAKVQVTRASSLYGTMQERTITFEVIAEDDSIKRTYNVELIKEKDPANIQPFYADPFMSEFIFAQSWSNHFVEIANPGNQPIDLSNYLIGSIWSANPADLFSWYLEPTAWLNRFNRYVPGYKWVGEAQWAVTPGILVQDLNINPILMPGEVFALGTIRSTHETWPSWNPTYKWMTPEALDVQFNNGFMGNNPFYPNGFWNPWNEPVSADNTVCGKWDGAHWFIFKILNDSVKLGLKPTNDPNDFELIEAWGMSDGSPWIIGGLGTKMNETWIRKPHIYKGNPVNAASFGTNKDDSEWIYIPESYWVAQNAGWPQQILNSGNDLGKHFMNEPTHYKSTVSSTVYKVSEGYSMNEKIIGAKTGTTVAEFLNGIIKSNENQTLKFMRAVTGQLAMADVLLMNDTLSVMSADSTNITKYLLSVTDEGLSSNAVITSTRYTVTIEQQPKSASAEAAEAGIGNVKGFDYGTALRTVLANINVPTGATMTVIDVNGAYVPLKMLNFDSTYINVTVNDNIYLSVVAENGITEIVYQLIPSTSDNDAFVLSDVYNVVQRDLLIQNVPRTSNMGGNDAGNPTNVSTFLSNLIPSAGATMKVVDKMGHERFDGSVADDDKLVVTSKNGLVSRTYYISKLATAAVPSTTYLAYILSNVYGVDQVANKVAGVSGDEPVSAFLGKVTAAPGASAQVVDEDGNAKTSGDIDATDMVLVTSADGKMKVYYTFGPLTSVNVLDANNIQLYPNPTNGEINVSGLKAGYRVQVYNSVGAAIRDINVQNSIERISLRNQPAGMYMVVVRENNKILVRFKALKK